MEPGIAGWSVPNPSLMIVFILAIGFGMVHWNATPRAIRETPKAVAGLALIAGVAAFVILLLRAALG